jgi:hypothetical protein
MAAAQKASHIPQQLQLNGLSRECETDNYCKTIRKYLTYQEQTGSMYQKQTGRMLQKQNVRKFAPDTRKIVYN